MNKQQNTDIVPMELSNKINRWNYDKSVEKMRELGRQWGKITAQVARELYIAKEYLTDKNMQRQEEHTWINYCEEIQLDRQIADYWIKKFIPREISPNGKDVLLLKAPMKTEPAPSRALLQVRLNEVLRTGERPTNWADEEEIELQKQMKNARLAEIAESCNAPTYFKANDYFSEALKRSKDITNFKLENAIQIQAQYKVFKYIEEYLSAFEDSETQARAAFNLALRARNYANEYAEKNFQIKNAQYSEGVGDDS